MQLTPREYLEYVRRVAEEIGRQGDYITSLDAATGDGDHWLNLNIGFQKLMKKIDDFEGQTEFGGLFLELAKQIMTGMGGTSGALYGSMYLVASKALGGRTALDENDLSRLFTCWSDAIIMRGNTQPGQKTMVDALYPAAQAFKQELEQGRGVVQALTTMKQAALEGAEATKEMAASRGRASNQPDRGVGHLDPGAVTMAIQLECLADFVIERCL